MEEEAEYELVSKNLILLVRHSKKEKEKYIPPMDHPWRNPSFMNFATKTKAPLWC